MERGSRRYLKAFAEVLDALRKRRIAHDTLSPYLLKETVFLDEFSVLPHQKDKCIDVSGVLISSPEVPVSDVQPEVFGPF